MQVELVNVLCGLVRTAARHVFVQALGRSVVALALLRYPTLQPHPATTVLLLAWALGDILRHAFYGAWLLETTAGADLFVAPSWLTYARYTVTPAAYIVGLGAELGLYWAAYPLLAPVLDGSGAADLLPELPLPLSALSCGGYLLGYLVKGVYPALRFMRNVRQQKLRPKKKAKRA